MAIAIISVPHQWRPIPDAALRSTAISVAIDVARRLSNAEAIEAAAVDAKIQIGSVGAPQWASYGLAQGYAGLALLFEQLDRCFPDDDWGEVAHRYLEIAARGAAAEPYLEPSGFGGLGGLAFAAAYLSRGGLHYQRFIATIEEHLVATVRAAATDLRDRRTGVPVSLFDTISGLSGLCVYLRGRSASPTIHAVLLEAIGSLIELSKEDDGLPRWHTSPRWSSPDDFMLQQFPEGYLNFGLAHGIPGPLVTLSLASLSGVSYDGLDEAIERLAGWLVAHRLTDEWGVNWPAGLGLAVGDNAKRVVATEATGHPAQAGWCYGSPGVARALYLAGLALRKEEFCNLAIQAIVAVLRRPWKARQIGSPTFCHGIAGLLQIILRFANDTAHEEIMGGATILTRQLLTLFEPGSLLGFRAIGANGNRIDQPGMLDGAPGVALVLLATALEAEPEWDRIFLLS